jgi:hypothetical protein
MSLEQLRDAAGHVNVTTTEGYLRGFDSKRVTLDLDAIPELRVSGREGV